MKAWRPVVLVVLLGVVLGTAGAAQAQDPAFYIASDSYFRMNVPAGTLDARVEATVQSTEGELSEIFLWAMPQAQDIVVKSGDTVLETTREIAGSEPGSPVVVLVALPKPLKGALRSTVTMTYTMPAQQNDVVKAEPGSIEALFISQGAGSFVFIDVPASSDNFVEPGCIEVANQPFEVADAGFLRYVCGETLILAVYGNADETIERCARLADECRQRLVTNPYIGFAQAVTDPAMQRILTADIEMASGTKTLQFKYFRTDLAWAEQQFETAKAALPKLEALFGFPYPHDNVVLRESNLIRDAGFLGLAFTDRGEMLVANTHGAIDDREVTVHEIAHQWAGLNLEQPFAWEGLAEWANYTISPQLGIGNFDRSWETLGYSEPLGTWGAVPTTITNPNYWYGRSAAFWAAFETAVGGRANMSTVLGMLDDTPKARDFDSRWFQDRGEEVSGANLDELFLSWVYVRDTATPVLQTRRAAHDAVRPLRERASTMLLADIPHDIQANLDAWAFGRVADQVAAANGLLDHYAALLARAAQDGGVGAGLGTRWNEMTIAEVRAVLDQMEQAMDAMDRSASNLANGVDDPASREALLRARESFLTGDYATAKALAAGASSISYNKDAAAKLIEIAQRRDAEFSPNFLQKIGLFFADPSASVDEAETAYAAGDYETALAEASSAIKQWSESQEQGLFRLSLVVFGMFGVVIGGWFLVRRFEKKRTGKVLVLPREGHVLPEPQDRSSSWQEWLNQKDSQ